MEHRSGFIRVLALALAFTIASGCTTMESPSGDAGQSEMNGTAIHAGPWRLVSFTGADGQKLTSSDVTDATVEFHSDGRAALKLAINRGSSSWKLGGRNEIELGVMALTRAASPPDPLRDRFTQDWGSIRTFELADGRLFLSLADEAGRYEFERAAPQPN